MHGQPTARIGLPSRRIALVRLTPRPDADELGPLVLPSCGIRRIQAIVAGDAAGGEIGRFWRSFPRRSHAAAIVSPA
jgi:hypothetical protein